MSLPGAARAGFAIAFLFGVGWGAARGMSRAGAHDPAPVPFSGPGEAEYESATVRISARGSLAARSRLFHANRDGIAILVRDEDRSRCEDLGRQLRELIARAPAHAEFVLATDSAAVRGYTTFVRREHLRVPIVVFPADSLLLDGKRLATPAVVVTRDGGRTVDGVSHPRRFPNVREKSFADEVLPSWR